MTEMMQNKKKKKKWIRPRHRLVRNIASMILHPYTRIKYGLTVEKFKQQTKRAYLILYNHQTPFDQFFVGMSFSGAVYYLATEDIFSNGFTSSLIRYLVAPIPIKKQTMDIGAIRKCIQVAKEGGTIAIAPEGNRTYSGRTEYINPSIAPLAKKLGLPIALYRIEGGYGVQPRWSDVIRKGKMRAYVSKVIEPEEYSELSNRELADLINDGLYVNEANADGRFKHKQRAEYIERLLYVCPYCGLSSFESRGEKFKCIKCSREMTYGENREICGVGFELPFRFVGEWYSYQNRFISSLDLTEYEGEPMYTDCVDLFNVIPEKRKEPIKRSSYMKLYTDKITFTEDGVETLTMMFDDIFSIAVLGRNKLNIYYGDDIYQVKGCKRFNAVKYVNIYHHYKNIKSGVKNGEFLGL